MLLFVRSWCYSIYTFNIKNCQNLQENKNLPKLFWQIFSRQSINLKSPHLTVSDDSDQLVNRKHAASDLSDDRKSAFKPGLHITHNNRKHCLWTCFFVLFCFALSRYSLVFILLSWSQVFIHSFTKNTSNYHTYSLKALFGTWSQTCSLPLYGYQTLRTPGRLTC